MQKSHELRISCDWLIIVDRIFNQQRVRSISSTGFGHSCGTFRHRSGELFVSILRRHFGHCHDFATMRFSFAGFPIPIPSVSGFVVEQTPDQEDDETLQGIQDAEHVHEWQASGPDSERAEDPTDSQQDHHAQCSSDLRGGSFLLLRCLNACQLGIGGFDERSNHKQEHDAIREQNQTRWPDVSCVVYHSITF